MSDQNQFLGQTRLIPRPTGSERKYRYQTIVSLERDQVQWDVADAYRWERRSSASESTSAEVQRAELETRIRLAYLATANGSIREWERSHDQIIADFVRGEDALLRRRRSDRAFALEQGTR
jgi:hypothetical protein